MVRIKHAVATRKRKKRVLKKAKGQFGQRSTRYQQAIRSVTKGMEYAFRDNRAKKREIRKLWIARINAGCALEEISYSQFIRGLKKASVEVDRKILSELAISSPGAFRKLVKIAQEANDSSKKK